MLDHVSVSEAVGLSPRPYPRCTNTVGLGRFSLPFPKEWQHSAVQFEPTHEDFRVVGYSPENQRVTRLFSVNTDSAPLSVTRK